jgi:hypothetical protein
MIDDDDDDPDRHLIEMLLTTLNDARPSPMEPEADSDPVVDGDPAADHRP